MPIVRNSKHPARSSIVAATLVALLVPVAVLSTGTDGSPPASATAGGSPYDTPVVVDENPADGIVETTLVAEEALVDIGNGVTAKGVTFNGTVPGPEFRLRTGDRVVVHFENRMTVGVTSIHWHGIELNNRSDGAPVTQNEVPPGGRFRYEFDVPRPGIFWYHPHFEGSTNQVFKGLEGSIIVTDGAGDEERLVAAGVLPAAEQTRTLLLGDTTVCKEPGSNDATTYPPDPNLPWAGGPPGSYPGQAGPHPVQLCETEPLDDHGDRRLQPYQAGEIPNVQSRAARHNEGQTVLTNGRNVGARAGYPEAPGALAAGASSLDVRPGEGLRLQVINGAAIRYFRLLLTDGEGRQIPLVRVGGQAGLLDEAVVEGGTPGGFDTKFARGEIVLAPAERADVVAAIPAGASGAATLWTLDYSRTATGFSGLPSVPVMHLNLTGSATTPAYTIDAGTPLLADPRVNHPNVPVGEPTGALLDPATFSPPKPGSSDPTMRFTAGDRVFPFGVDGLPGPHEHHGGYVAAPRTATTRYARLGDTLELAIENQTSQHHPFHLHGFSFQPLALEWAEGGGPDYVFPYVEYRDEVDLPPGYVLRFRVRLDDRPHMDGTTMGGGLGRWMFHCHIFPHSTLGMMAEIIVVDGSGNERPNIDADAPAVRVRAGDVASLTGTFSDPDGDATTLRASSGAVTDNGDGTWTWTDRAAQADGSRTVYLTATDVRGNQAQEGFFVDVGPPAEDRPPEPGTTAPVEPASPGAGAPPAPGYRMVAADGGVFTFGDRAFAGSAGDLALNSPIVGGAADPARSDGYWMVGADGGVFSFGSPFFGSLGGGVRTGAAVAMEPTPSGLGYWVVLGDGTVHAFGGARHLGDVSGQPLTATMVAMAATSTGAGYWLVAADGGVFSFGDATFFGSTGNLALAAPVVDMAPVPGDGGYHLVAADGGVFSFGSAQFRGSTGGMTLNSPVVAGLATRDGGGYWLAANDGGLFALGTARFLGSMGGTRLNAPVVDVVD